MSRSLNVIVSIIGIAIIIGGLYLFAKIAILIGILVLGLVFVVGILGFGSSDGREEIERRKWDINELKRERDKIPTYNGFLGGSGLSESKIQYNRKRRDELDEEIQDKQRELDDMQR